MRVAVVIPTWNEAESIGASVDSAWTAGADEIIVVDGGSDDQTLERASVRATQVLASTRGRGRQQNAGAAAASADWLLFLHADNRLHSTAIEQLRRAAENPDMQCGAYRQSIEDPARSYRLLEWGNALRVRCWGVPYGDQAIFVRRDVFESLGRFPETPLMEDYILMRSLRRRAWPVLLAGPVYVSPRRWKKNGILRQTVRNWAFVCAYRLGVSAERLARWYDPHSAAPARPVMRPATSPKERPQ